MIIGIGNDLINCDRIEKTLNRFGKRFEERCFTAYERQKAASRSQPYLVYAKRFAAKEACAKALGTGFSQGIEMRDIGVVEDDMGRPFLELTGGALMKLNALTPMGMVAVIHLSLTDEPPYAQAFVIIEALPDNPV